MSNEVVKYHNNLNNLSFAGFKEKELDLFFTICFKLREQGGNKVEIDFSELKELTELKKRPERLKSYILQLNKKLLALNYQMEVRENEYQAFVFFTTLYTNFNTKKLEIAVNEPFLYLLNNLVEKYTKFDLLEFISLKSVYSKKMFKSLKQWESVKSKDFTIEEFRDILAIPPKYRLSEIDKKVLSPIMEELPRYFPNLKLEKIKTGRKITELKFSWRGKKETLAAEIVEVQISEKLSKAIEKAKKNRFIEKLFTDENIEKLLNKFEEDTLIKGLNACYKDIQKDVKSLNYLIKAIETAAAKKTKKIVVKKEKTDQEKIKPDSKENNSTKVKEEIKTDFKEKVLESEFKSIYKYYLGKNGLVDNPLTKKAFSMKYEIVKKIVLPEELAKIVTKYSITDNQITDGMSDGYTREETIKLIESNLLENSKMPEELQKEYEEFLAWKKWNEERTNKK